MGRFLARGFLDWRKATIARKPHRDKAIGPFWATAALNSGLEIAIV
jgi:hypothetical protein